MQLLCKLQTAISAVCDLLVVLILTILLTLYGGRAAAVR